MRFVGLAILLFVSVVRGQIPSSSPALDSDCVTLQPKETFEGRYANQNVGGMIHTVAPLNWQIPEGCVFINNVDTAGYTNSQIEKLRPTGAFRQNIEFSVFNRALFRINGLYNPVTLFTKGKG